MSWNTDQSLHLLLKTLCFPLKMLLVVQHLRSYTVDHSQYSPLGNSMRSHVLLRLVGGKELWKSMRAASSLCLENMVLIIDTFTCVFACLEFT